MKVPKDDEINLRYAIGIIKGSYVQTHPDLKYGLKFGDGVVIIHKDDLLLLLKFFNDFPRFRTKFLRLFHILERW